MKKIFIVFLLLIIPISTVWSYEFVDFIGKKPAEIFEKYSTPTEVFPFRGNSPEEDDVVFYYPDRHLYLFFYNNVVWQFRFDHNFKEDVSGLKIGDTRENVDDLLGVPYYRGTDGDVYVNPGKFGRFINYKFKVRICYDKDNCVSDIYVYRSNF